MTYNLKTTYERPTCDLITIQTELNLLTVSTQGNTIQDATIDPWDFEL